MRLKIDFEKTKVIFDSFFPKEKIVYNTTEIKKVQNIVYHGQEITSQNSIINEINTIIIINLQSGLGKSSIVLKSKVPLCLKRKVFYECILPAFTQVAETWMIKKSDGKNNTNNTAKCGKVYVRHNKKIHERNNVDKKVFDIVEWIKRLK